MGLISVANDLDSPADSGAILTNMNPGLNPIGAPINMSDPKVGSCFG